jgi:hypothetical protein
VDSLLDGGCPYIVSHRRAPLTHPSFYFKFTPCARSFTDASLSRLADKLIVSFVYSHDVVARLSLGSVRDLKNAALWLCEANETKEAGDGYVAVTTRARQWKAGHGTADDMDWVGVSFLL